MNLYSEKEWYQNRSKAQGRVQKKNFSEVNLITDHESQAEPASDAGGEEDVIIPDSGQWIHAVVESSQRTNQDCVEDFRNPQTSFTIFHESKIGIQNENVPGNRPMFIDAAWKSSLSPECEAGDADIGGDNIGNVSHRNEHDAVLLPLDQTWSFF